jgi:hypothetical protein
MEVGWQKPLHVGANSPHALAKLLGQRLTARLAAA